MNKDRLLKLAEFLEQLPSESFDFSSFVDSYDQEKECGSVCCAIGWMPKVFPDLCQWKKFTGFSFSIDIVTIGSNHTGFFAAQEIFDIDDDASSYLFCPRADYDDNDVRLPETASAVDVANRIREFVANEGAIA